MCDELKRLQAERLKAEYDFRVLLTRSNSRVLLHDCKVAKAAIQKHRETCPECKTLQTAEISL